MKLLGYNRISGEKDGRKWDFVQLVLETEFKESSANNGGSQLYLQYNPNRGHSLPSVPTETFLKALKQGMKVGSEINVYRDLSGGTIIDVLVK